MAYNNSFNAACDLNEYLYCKMPMRASEVQLKVKTTWGKFTMVQDNHTKTEKYHTWEKAQRNPNRSRKRKAPHKMTSKQTEIAPLRQIYLQVKDLDIHHESSLTPHT